MSLYTKNLHMPIEPFKTCHVHKEFIIVMGLHKYSEENVFSQYVI